MDVLYLVKTTTSPSDSYVPSMPHVLVDFSNNISAEGNETLAKGIATLAPTTTYESYIRADLAR